MKPFADFGLFIRSSRLAQNRTQRELAKLVGTSQAYIDKIEHNQIDPRLSTVLRLLRALGFEAAAFSKAEQEIMQPLLASLGKKQEMLIPEEESET